MKYSKFSYLYPPRPQETIDHHTLHSFQKREWWGQFKKNGQCSLVAVAPDRKLTVMNRHKSTHKMWTAHRGTAEAFQDLPGQGWYVFVGELLHSKGIGVKDTHFLFDVLVADGEFLYGSKFAERVDRINELFPDTEADAYSHRVIDKHTWVAKTFRKPDLLALYHEAVKMGDEGIVMKDPNGPLDLCMREGNNSGWQIKCRKANGSYGF